MTEQERGPSTMSNLDELLGKLLGRHHREMMVSREHCVACNQFSPTFDEVRTAARRAEALEKAAQEVLAADGAVARGAVGADRLWDAALAGLDAVLDGGR